MYKKMIPDVKVVRVEETFRIELDNKFIKVSIDRMGKLTVVDHNGKPYFYFKESSPEMVEAVAGMLLMAAVVGEERQPKDIKEKDAQRK